jgi:branched-subunit amino acid ABC-type transport system permease component
MAPGVDAQELDDFFRVSPMPVWSSGRESVCRYPARSVIGSGIENWVPYVLALLFLLVRPAGLFGERAIERV